LILAKSRHFGYELTFCGFQESIVDVTRMGVSYWYLCHGEVSNYRIKINCVI